MKTEKIQHELTNFPVPPPPAELAERIKAEIPDSISTPDVVSLKPKTISPRRQWRLAAAAVMTIAFTGAITWEMRHRQPSEDLFYSAPKPIHVTPLMPVSDPILPVTIFDEPDYIAIETDPVVETIAEVTPPRATAVAIVEQPSATPIPAKPSSTTESGTTGRLAMTVLDNEGLSLPGVTVTITSDRLIGGPQVAITGSTGGALFNLLPTGIYRVQPNLPGFKSASADVRVVTGRVGTVNFNMVPEQFGGVIEVTAECPVVDSAQVNTSVVFDQDYLQQAAIGTGRDYREIISQASGTIITNLPASTGGTAEPNDAPYYDVFFREYGVNPFIDTEDDRYSTFGLEVDTGSYTVARRYLNDGHLPPREAIRVEEIVNYFNYPDEGPAEADFALAAEGAPTPFAAGQRYRVVRFAVTARTVDRDQRPPAVLTFVIDVSGSMSAENRLGLVKKSLNELLAHLRSDDRVGLVVYGSRGQVLLEPTTDHEKIRSAIGSLHPNGSTNAEEGLVLAYDLAARYLDSERINRIILCSDGVANVGRTGPDSILERIRSDADRGIELTTVGFGMGNYNDVLMEQLADAGDGRYAYVDGLSEARRLFVEELTGTLLTLGHEAKAQVEFNPEVVSRYRLLGYENRAIADDRFRDPTVDAGEIGAGHTVTALYEIKLKPWASKRKTMATLRFRYRPMGSDEPIEMERTIRIKDLARTWGKASPALRLATLSGEYGELLKGTYWSRGGSFNEVLRLGQELSPAFAGDTRVADFLSLVANAAEMSR